MWSRTEEVVRVQLYLPASTAMMIRMRLERMIDGYWKGCVSAEEIFQTSSTYMMVNVNGHLYRSRMTKEVESMFEFLGMGAGNPEKHDEFDLVGQPYHVLSQICHSHMNGGLIVPAYGFIRTRSGTVAPQVRFQFKTQSNERIPDRGSYNAWILLT